MRSPWSIVSPILFLTLGGLLWANPGPALAQDHIAGLASAELSQAEKFAGYYEYRIEIYWKLAADLQEPLFWLVDVPGYQDICDGKDPLYGDPAGTSDGVHASVPCTVAYDGSFACLGDPTIPPAFVGEAVLFKQGTPLCQLAARGTGVLFFYSTIPPDPPSMHRNALALTDGSTVIYGDVFGSLPVERADPPVPRVVINEFLVRPPTSASEFIELFNVTGATINLNGWTLSVHQRGMSAEHVFGAGDNIPAAGYRVESGGFTITCPICVTAPQRVGDEPRPQVGTDFLFDSGGVIILRDSAGVIVDQVGYGNLGGAPISCPLVTVADTVATSTSRTPNATDTGQDAADLNVGSPTPGTSNTAAPPELGTSLRINRIYAFPQNYDGNPTNEGLQIYNPRSTTVDMGEWHISDGFLIRPIFAHGSQVPVEPNQGYSVFEGTNGTVAFELEQDDRLDLYDMRTAPLVRVDQLGWSRDPPYFPDSCFVRTPNGTGPADGWDWNTSGGFVNLFYVEGCGLEAPTTPVEAVASPASGLLAPWPNPAGGQRPTTIAFLVDPSIAGNRFRLVVHDVSGRRVRELARGTYPPGRYAKTWDGRDGNGGMTSPGVYFVRLEVEGSSRNWTRTLVRVSP